MTLEGRKRGHIVAIKKYYNTCVTHMQNGGAFASATGGANISDV